MSRARETAAHGQRLAAVGALSAGVAHDLRNSLGGVLLRIHVLEQDPSCRAQRENLSVIEAVLRDAMDALGRLQDVARGRVGSRAGKTDLPKAIGDAALLARSGLRDSGLRLDVRLPRLPPVSGSPAELKHVFLNLFLNASDAMPRGGTVRVRARNGGDHVIVTVADEGHGIAPEHRPHVFEPFFTTKGSRGLGLGLPMAKEVLARAGGSIQLRAGKRKGTTFQLQLPVAKAPRKRAGAVRSRAGRAGRRGGSAPRRSAPGAS